MQSIGCLQEGAVVQFWGSFCQLVPPPHFPHHRFPATAPALGPQVSPEPCLLGERGMAAATRTESLGCHRSPGGTAGDLCVCSPGGRNVCGTQSHDWLRGGAAGARTPRGQPERNRDGTVGCSAGWGGCSPGLRKRGADGEGGPWGIHAGGPGELGQERGWDKSPARVSA